MRRLGIIVALLVTVIAVSPALESDSVAKKATCQCGDGIDNDLDGRTDYPSDPGCRSGLDQSETGNKKTAGF